jgi:Zn-dependent alcohol dehydrogenase
MPAIMAGGFRRVPRPRRRIGHAAPCLRRPRVSHGGDHVPEEDFPRYAQLALDGELDLAAMVTKTIGLEDVEHAFEEMRAGDVIRSVVRP